MKITIEIPSDRIANLMISAIESGDPVTTASRGGWCAGIDNASKKPFSGDWWYADPKYFEGRFVFDVAEVVDEDGGNEVVHKVRPADMLRGLGVMAKQFPGSFARILEDDTDAADADLFLQSVVFGEAKYG